LRWGWSNLKSPARLATRSVAGRQISNCEFKSKN